MRISCIRNTDDGGGQNTCGNMAFHGTVFVVSIVNVKQVLPAL